MHSVISSLSINQRSESFSVCSNIGGQLFRKFPPTNARSFVQLMICSTECIDLGLVMLLFGRGELGTASKDKPYVLVGSSFRTRTFLEATFTSGSILTHPMSLSPKSLNQIKLYSSSSPFCACRYPEHQQYTFGIVRLASVEESREI